jgi:myo-inositol-1(or 4)-monophosphatase
MSERSVPEDIADTLLALARSVGEQIERALPEVRTVQYKKEQTTPTDPVSEVDRELERFLRREIGQRFPDHSILGEELGTDEKASRYTWALDPIDGTTNFVNGFPLFASSIGVLEHGRPLAGAVWASTSHALRPGVYHVGSDGGLRFDGVALTRREIDPTNRRFLSGEPGGMTSHPGWDHRWTGSAAIECAMVAAGILHSSRLLGTYIWDVAGGLALVQAAGGHVKARRDGAWQRFESFATTDDTTPTALARWREDLLIGSGPTLERWIAAAQHA